MFAPRIAKAPSKSVARSTTNTPAAMTHRLNERPAARAMQNLAWDLRGTELIIERDAIVNVSRVAGQGRLVNAAFEQAAIAAARQAGAATARVAFHTVVNAEWSAYLESLGYGYEVIAGTTPGSILTRVLTKVIAL
jgi:hypothetical protein